LASALWGPPTPTAMLLRAGSGGTDDLAIRAKWLATRERNDGDGEKRESEWSMHNKVTSY